MKAYIVQEDCHDGESVIEFAKHAVVARREGSSQLGYEFGSVTCRRVPEYDKYAEQGFVPRYVLIQDGWWFTCYGPKCGKHVSRDTGGLVLWGGNPFCSLDCCEAYKVQKQS